MMDLSRISIDDFEPCLGQTFRVHLDNADAIDLELIQVKPLGAIDSKTQARQSFSLLFRGPLQPMFEQQVLSIENSTLGELALFLVPIGPDDEGMLYDSTFN
jgi:hypothetical protein